MGNSKPRDIFGAFVIFGIREKYVFLDRKISSNANRYFSANQIQTKRCWPCIKELGDKWSHECVMYPVDYCFSIREIQHPQKER